MIIKKYLHSCIMIESGGKRLLIDPGRFSFMDKTLKPQDIGHVDAILITHKHSDHFDIEALKKLVDEGTEIFTNEEVAELLTNEDLPCETMRINTERDIAGFSVEALAAQHGDLPVPKPLNTAFLINDKILHPGDSFDVLGLSKCDILLLPVAAPWLRLTDAMFFAKKMKPKTVIPIHDFMMKDFMLEPIYDMCKESLSESKIAFKPLLLWEEMHVTN